MANTFIKIASVTVGAGGATNIEFTSIPQNFTDLFLVTSVRTDRSSVTDNLAISFNNDYTSVRNRELYGTGSIAASGNDPAGQFTGYIAGDSVTASIFGSAQVYIPNYTSSNYKSSSAEAVGENNSASSYMALSANLWSKTNAITSIKLTPYLGNNIKQYSTATLYGIKSS